MADRSSRPRYGPNAVDQAIIDRIIALRRPRRTGQHIAMAVGVSPATVSRVAQRRRPVAAHGHRPGRAGSVTRSLHAPIGYELASKPSCGSNAM